MKLNKIEVGNLLKSTNSGEIYRVGLIAENFCLINIKNNILSTFAKSSITLDFVEYKEPEKFYQIHFKVKGCKRPALSSTLYKSIKDFVEDECSHLDNFDFICLREL